MTRACVHCGEHVRYQIGSAKYRNLCDGRYGPARCRDRDTHAAVTPDEHVADAIVALDGGQESLFLDGGAA